MDTVFLLDPLIATGGTAIAGLHMILDWGIPGSMPISGLLESLIADSILYSSVKDQVTMRPCFTGWS